MVNKARAKGTQWESKIVEYLQECGWRYAERRALQGSVDRGDIAGVPAVVIEAKSAAKILPGPWLNEAHVERDNDKADLGVVWFKRRGKTSAGEGFVLMDGRTFTQLLIAAGYK